MSERQNVQAERAKTETRVQSTPELAAYDVAELTQQAAQAYRHVRFDPRSLTPGGILALQRTIGNAAVNQLLRWDVVQRMAPPARTGPADGALSRLPVAGIPPTSIDERDEQQDGRDSVPASLQRQTHRHHHHGHHVASHRATAAHQGSTGTGTATSTAQQPAPAALSPVDQAAVQAEWTAHAAIQKRYATAQAYQVVRQRVASWGIADPAAYIESAIQEWTANPAIHGPFDHNLDGDPHRSYLNLKRLYQARGIDDPARYLACNIVPITFYNRKTQGHGDLQAVLKEAQDTMTAAGHTFILDKGTWSFVPRTFNDNINKLSNHALGRAIDVNPGDNPHITSASDIRVIDAVCQAVLPNGLGPTTDVATLRAASQFFQQHFNDAWVTQQEQLLQSMQSQHPHPPEFARQQKLVTAIHVRRPKLNAYAASGFLNLPEDLVHGLRNVGLSWGGEWHSAKDFMHFELLNA